MIPQKTIQRVLLCLFCLLIYGHSQSQQKIQIKDGTKDVGHFSVEIFHNLPGKPMNSFSGNGGKIEVKQESNSFVLKLQNFLWYEGETELMFNLDDITFKSSAQASVKQENKQVSLKSIPNYIREIYFQIDGTGNVKMSIPFSYDGGKGKFLQDFTISTKQEAVQELSSKDIREIWNDVDDKSKSEVMSFLEKYGDLSSAKKYIKKADRALEDINSRELLAAEEARIQGKNKPQKQVARIEIIEEGELDSEKLVEDVTSIVDSLNLGDEMLEELRLFNLSLINGDDIKLIEVAEKEMPLQMNLKEVGENEMELINSIPVPTFSRDSAIEINQSLLDENNIKGIFNEYSIINAQGVELFKSNIVLQNKATDATKTNYLIYGLLALLLGLGGFVFFNSKKKKKQQEESKKKIQQKIAENKETSAKINQDAPKIGAQNTHEGVPSEKAGAKGKIVIGQKKQEMTANKLVPEHSVPRKNATISTGKIKITKKKKSGQAIEYAEFVKLVNASKTVNVNLGHLWSDTRIQNVYLTPEFIQDLDQFLAESSNEGIQNELQGAVPEVGGFLMGRFAENDKSLQVLVEKFVAFVPEYNDVFKIEIGTKTVVDELGDAQDKNPLLEVIGWFHTHPGHGLFLSTSDLAVQRHFPADYQVAMEIDSLTKGLDMSFFTRQSTGRMNNSVDRKEGVGWFQWVEIENNNLN